MNTIKESIHQFSVLTAHHEAVELQELILIPSEYNGLTKKKRQLEPYLTRYHQTVETTKKKDNWNPISHVIIKQLNTARTDIYLFFIIVEHKTVV